MAPIVGKTHYGYDESGMKAAKGAAKRTGKPVVMTKPAGKGGGGGTGGGKKAK